MLGSSRSPGLLDTVVGVVVGILAAWLALRIIRPRLLQGQGQGQGQGPGQGQGQDGVAAAE